MAQHRLAQAQSLVRVRGHALSSPPSGGHSGVMNRRTLLLGAACAASLAACAPVTQRPGLGQLGYRGPRLDDGGLYSFDGKKLGLMKWLPPEGTPVTQVIVGLHGMNDYSKAFHLA